MTADQETIEAVKAGNRDRFAELVQRHQRMVYAVAWSRLGDAELCEEAAQETFVKAFRYLVALRHPERFAGWLARIARNVSASLLRARRRELARRTRWGLEHVDRGDVHPIEAEGESLHEALGKALENLPEAHRECLVCFYTEGKDIRETAQTLGISEAAAKTRLHRARQALRGCLEGLLETSLSRLEPPKDFPSGVMTLLPPMPVLAAGLGGSAAAVKGGTGLAKAVTLSCVLALVLIQGIYFTAIFGVFAKLEASNLAPGAGKEIRKTLIRRNMWILVFSGVTAMLFSMMILRHAGISSLFQALAVFCAWGTYSAARVLRVNRLPFTKGMVLANATFLAVTLLIGFFHAPYWTFAIALLPLNVVLYFTNKSRPARHDYNLFLRCMSGMAGRARESAPLARPLTQWQLLAFMRFLGERYLVRDYAFDGESLVLHLPPVRQGLEQQFGFSGVNSSIRISPDGSCAASLGVKDYRSLVAIADGAHIDGAELETRVSELAACALSGFVEGNAEQAEAVLQPESDASVFEKPVGQSKAHRVVGILAIVAAGVFLALMASISYQMR